MPLTAERQAEIEARVDAEIKRGAEQIRALQSMFAESRDPARTLSDQLMAAGLTGELFSHVFRVACAYALDERRRAEAAYRRGAA